MMPKVLLERYGYAFGYILNAGFNFLLAIFLTNYLSKEDFGMFSIYRAAIFTLWPFIGLSTHYFLQVEYHKQKLEEFQTLTCSSISLNFLFFIIVQLIGFLFLEEISRFLDIEKFWILTIPFVALLLSFVRIGLVLMQVKKQLFSFLTIALFQIGLNILITYYLVVLSAENWEGRAYGLLLSNVSASFLVLYLLLKQNLLKFRLTIPHLSKAYKFGLAAIMLDICLVLIGFSDKLMIKKYVSTESLGVYAVALQLAAVIGVVDSAFTQALYPKIYDWLSKNEFKKVTKLSIQYIFGLAIFATIYSLIAPLIYSFFVSSEFEESYIMMRWIIIAFCFLSLYKILVSRIYYYDKAKKLIFPSLVIIVINLIAHYFLVPKLGVMGAITTNIISYFSLVIAVFLILRKIEYKKTLSKELDR